MRFDDDLKAHLELTACLYQRAAAYPGADAVEAGRDPRAELRRVCDWLVAQQNSQGLWVENAVNLRFYSDAYAVRGLLAGWRLLGERHYLDAVCRWLEHLISIQRGDGGWWVGYSAGDHDYDTPDADQSVVYVADAGEVSLALVIAAQLLNADNASPDLAKRVTDALLRFRGFCEAFRLRTGGMGLGYTRRDFYSTDKKRMLPFMQAHHQPWTFATAVTGVNTYAGLFTLTHDRQDWDKAMTSLDWILDRVPEKHDASGHGVASNNTSDILVLHRVMDWLFACCPETLDQASHNDPTPEPRFASPQRERLYTLWKHVMHRVADRQSELGDWPLFVGGRQVVRYGSPLRHRLIFGYALTAYLARMGTRDGEDDRLTEARDRQLWLADDPHLQQAHYGICVPGVHMMPTGLWAMTQAELIQPGITLPGRSAASG